MSLSIFSATVLVGIAFMGYWLKCEWDKKDDYADLRADAIKFHTQADTLEQETLKGLKGESPIRLTNHDMSWHFNGLLTYNGLF